jgi:hypothetical protein
MDTIEKFGDAGGYEAIEPVVGQDQTLAMELLVSGATGSKPSLRPGQTVVVRLETTTDKFVYCFYKDGYGRVMRIFPNRFQSNDFVPAGQSVEIPPGPERPFNIRLDKAGQVEAIACLASSTKVDPDLIGDAKNNDLAPIPSLELEGILQAFKRLSGSGSSTVTMPIKVMNDPKGWSEAGLVGSWPSMSLSNVQPSRP